MKNITLLFFAILMSAMSWQGTAQVGSTCDDPLVVTGLPFNDSGNTADYGNNYDSSDVPMTAPDAVGSPSSYYMGGDDVVYAYTPTQDQLINISVTDHVTYTGVFVITGCPFSSTVGGHTLSSATTDLEVNGLPVETGETYYIIISTWAAPQSTDYVIDIIDVTPTCAAPQNLEVTELGTNNAVLEWDEPITGEPDSYLSRLVANDNTEPTSFGSMSGDNLAFSYGGGLTPNTDYYFWIKSDCGSEESDLAMIHFTTPCLETDIPFTQNFEGVTTPDIPNCGSLETNSGDRNGDGWYTSNVTSYGFSSKVLMHSYSSSGSPDMDDWYFTQGINLEPGIDYQISFKYGSNSSLEEKLKVAFGTSPASSAMNDPSNEIVDLTFEMSGSDEAEETFQVQQSDVYYFGFQIHSGANKFYLYVDDIAINLAPTCIKPTDLAVDNVTGDSVDVSWTTAANQSEIYVVEAGEPAPDASSIPTDSGMTSPSTLSGLDSSTTFDLYVRADCGSQDGVSEWEGPVTFTTLCLAVSDFSEGFESTTGSDLPNCWTKVGTTGSVNTQSSTKISGARVLYLYNGATVALPTVDNASANTHQMAMNVIGNISAGETIEFGYLTDSSDASSFVLLSSIVVNSITDPQSFETIPSGMPAGDVVFALHTVGGTSVLIDDVNWEPIPSCPKPTDLALEGKTSTTADISWTQGNTETAWNISWGTPSYTPGDNDEIDTGSATQESYQITTGLTENTEYDVYIQADCGGDESAWVGPLSFTTACDAITSLPYTENMDTYGTGPDAFPSCWERITYTSGTNVWPSIVAQSAAPSSPNSLKFQSATGTPTYAVSPSFTEDIHDLRVSFMLKREGTSSGTIDIGVMSNPLDSNTFELVQTIDPDNNDYILYEFNLNTTTLAGGNNHIALRHNSASSVWYYWLDDFMVDPLPSCPTPTDLVLDGATEVTADISWTQGNTETAWNISWGTPSYTPGDNDEISTDTASTTSYQITNLAADTAYDVYVQADCGGEESTWVGPLEVYTGYCIPTTTGSLAYIDDFTATGDSGQDISNIGSGSSLDGNGYSDFTNLPAIQATASSDVDFTVEIGSGSNTAGLRMWVDWGQNLSFGDQSSGEEVYASNSYEGTHTGTFTIPANASGTYRLRVGASYIPSSGPDDPCGLANSGEYEDYLLEVIAFSGYVYESGAWTPGDPSGVSTDSDNVLVIDGTASLTADTDVNNLTIMDGATLNINNVLNLHGDLTIDGDLVFVSNETGNGELGPVAASSIISGVATVQNYMSHNRSYRMVASSVVTSTSSIHAHWQEGATSSMDDPAPGFGTHITGSTTDQDNGFDATATGNPSMFTVDLANQEFEPIGNTDASYLAPGDGYLLFVRGDRSIDLTDNTSVGETVLRTKGYLATGAGGVNFATVNAGDFAMFGNPYQSAVDINSIFGNGGTSNINSGFYYVYDPTIGTHGAYVTVTLPAGTSTATSSANKYLQPGQGAQFATSANGASELEFTEANKAPGQFTTTSATGNNLFSDNMLTVQLFTTENFSNGGSEHDSFGIIFGDGLDNEITNADARKPMNFYENFGRDHNGTYLSIERREMPVPAEVYPLYSSGYNYADYTLKMNIDGLEDTFLYLDDHYTGTSTLLEGSDTVYTFSVDANNELSIATDRFSVRVEQRLGIDNNGLLAGVRLFPNPLNDNTFYINAPKLNGEQISVSISDLSGRQIFENMLDCRANTVTVSVNDNLASGVYLVTLRHGGEENTYRLVKK